MPTSTKISTARNTPIKCRGEVREARVRGSITLNTAKGPPIGIRGPANALASLRRVRLKTDKLIEGTEIGEVLAPVMEWGERMSVPGRVWVRVDLAIAAEQVTEVPLAGPGAGVVNVWRVNGGVRAAAVLVAASVVVVAPVVAVEDEAVEAEAVDNNAISCGKKGLSYNWRCSPWTIVLWRENNDSLYVE
jgi:hypothetical protein